MQTNIEYVSKLTPIFTKQKRIKIVVGGRNSTKSTGVADYVLAGISAGQLWCCGREFLNSMDESVHRTMLDEIERLQLSGFTNDNSHVYHVSGGRNFHKGMARNITSLKSTLSGIDGLWIEEGEDLSERTLRLLSASVRLSAKDSERLIDGEDIKMPEIIITMNRGSKNDPISKKYLARAESELERCGYYEDKAIMVVEVNYTDMPKAWFMASGLEPERADDFERMTLSEYESKWLGKYNDTVNNAIIKPEWFDAAIDAHKLDRLKKVFEPHGAVIVAHDPSDTGEDDKGVAVRHGSIILYSASKDTGEVDDGCDWAMGIANQYNADWFVWDGDGLGAGLKRQISDNFNGTKVKYHMFKGSLSGSGQDNAKQIYMPSAGDKDTKPKTYTQMFKNNRAQYYAELARRFYNTYKCVEKGDYIDPDDMISIDSDGVSNLAGLRAEICRIPKKDNPNGLIQIMNKQDMKKLGIDSPNESDSIMMCLFSPKDAVKVDMKFTGWG